MVLNTLEQDAVAKNHWPFYSGNHTWSSLVCATLEETALEHFRA
jgi:hypothetical protein